jgi:bifunctional enzyme CysN/CysC
VLTFSTQRPVPFASYKDCKALGAFILIDRITNETAGAGMIEFALRRASNLHWQSLEVDKVARARLNLHKPACFWFTGLSGAGKSTIANLLEKRLYAEDGTRIYWMETTCVLASTVISDLRKLIVWKISVGWPRLPN